MDPQGLGIARRIVLSPQRLLHPGVEGGQGRLPGARILEVLQIVRDQVVDGMADREQDPGLGEEVAGQRRLGVEAGAEMAG